MKTTLLLLAATAGVASAKMNWKPLFDGKTWAGWSVTGDQSFWKIGADSTLGGQHLSGSLTQYSMVFSDKADFDQFTVKYSYRLKAGCSGFFFRSIKTETTEKVRGMQVEAKYQDNGQRQVGSLYCFQCKDASGNGIDGWIQGSGNNALAYDRKIDRPDDQFQDVVLTVKNAFVYVNINGFQPIGGSEQGDQPPFRYDRTPIISVPGRFGLQVHGGQSRMDMAFKNIMILEGCTDATKPGYDSAQFMPGMPKHPAYYQHNPSLCEATGVGDSHMNSEKVFGSVEMREGSLGLEITYPRAHSLDIINLNGKTVFSGSSPTSKNYQFTKKIEAGVYLAKVQTETGSISRKIIIP